MLPSSQLIGPVFSVHKRVHNSVAAGLDCLLMDFCLLNVQTSQAKVVTDSPSGGWTATLQQIQAII